MLDSVKVRCEDSLVIRCKQASNLVFAVLCLSSCLRVIVWLSCPSAALWSFRLSPTHHPSEKYFRLIRLSRRCGSCPSQCWVPKTYLKGQAEPNEYTLSSGFIKACFPKTGYVGSSMRLQTTLVVMNCPSKTLISI